MCRKPSHAPDPTPEQIRALCRQIREEGYVNDQGEVVPPWPAKRYGRKPEQVTPPEVAASDLVDDL